MGREEYKEINALLEKRLEEKKVLIASHRGCWGGNIIENTIAAYKTAYLMGADLFECDLAESTDGILYVNHDGGELRLFVLGQNIKELSSKEIDQLIFRNSLGDLSMKHVERFEDVLAYFSNGELFNIDRAWDSLDKMHAIMQKYPQSLYQAIIKTPPEEKYLDFFRKCQTKYMYMPIVKTMDDIRRVLSYPGINTVGVEILAVTPEDELFKEENVRWLREQGLLVWANTITLNGLESWRLYGGLDDDLMLEKGPDYSWGVMMDRGINALQTDWPSLLYQYREKKFGQ